MSLPTGVVSYGTSAGGDDAAFMRGGTSMDDTSERSVAVAADSESSTCREEGGGRMNQVFDRSDQEVVFGRSARKWRERSKSDVPHAPTSIGSLRGGSKDPSCESGAMGGTWEDYMGHRRDMTPRLEVAIGGGVTRGHGDCVDCKRGEHGREGDTDMDGSP